MLFVALSAAGAAGWPPPPETGSDLPYEEYELGHGTSVLWRNLTCIIDILSVVSDGNVKVTVIHVLLCLLGVVVWSESGHGVLGWSGQNFSRD